MSHAWCLCRGVNPPLRSWRRLPSASLFLKPATLSCSSAASRTNPSTLLRPDDQLTKQSPTFLHVSSPAPALSSSPRAPKVPRQAQLLPPSTPLVYNAPLSQHMRRLKTFSFTTSGATLACQPLLYTKMASASLGAQISAGVLFSFFIFGTPVLLHQVVKKYVSALWWDEPSRTFEMETLSFFGRWQRCLLTPSDVERPLIPGMFTSIRVHGRPVFIDPASFNSADALDVLMGFDKPIDYEKILKVDKPPREKADKS